MIFSLDKNSDSQIVSQLFCLLFGHFSNPLNKLLWHCITGNFIGHNCCGMQSVGTHSSLSTGVDRAQRPCMVGSHRPW